MRKRQRDRLVYTSLLILCIVVFWLVENFYTPETYSSRSDDHLKSTVPSYFVPSTTTNVVIDHDHYSLSYNEDYEVAEWVIYGLQKDHLTYDERERPHFIEDPFIRTKSADWRNYRGSGYDRGHLCPAGDRRFSELAYKETFYTSNIVPQDPDFNAGIWNELEMQVRKWCKQYGTIYIATGGVLEPGLERIGDEDVAVPRAFYKIVARGTGKNIQVVSFLFPHQESTSPLNRFLVSVDQVEKQTGIDFFKDLPDDVEQQLENKVEIKGWRFTTIH